MIPQTNARLLAVNRGGFTEDYDRPSGSSPAIWTGNMEAYVQSKIRSTFGSNGELSRVLEVTLFIPVDLPVTIEPGDVLTYQAGNPSAPDTLAGKVQTFTDPAYLPQLQDYFKIALEDVNVP